MASFPTNEGHWDGPICGRRKAEPVWDQTTIDRLWVTTQREAMIESGPPATATKPQPSGASEQKVQKEQTKK